MPNKMLVRPLVDHRWVCPSPPIQLSMAAKVAFLTSPPCQDAGVPSKRWRNVPCSFLKFRPGAETMRDESTRFTASFASPYFRLPLQL